MYSFKYEFNDNYRYNTYHTYSEPILSTKNSYIQLRNRLLYILLFTLIFLAGMFSLKIYQNFTQKKDIQTTSSQLTVIKSEIKNTTKKQLTRAIAQSITKNLQRKKMITKLNQEELRLIIKKVVHQIEKKPKTIKYSQK